MRFRKWLTISVVLVILLTSCSSKGDHFEKQSGSLKVAYLYQNGFMPQYGNLLKGKFPNVDIEIVEIPFEAYRNPTELNTFVNTYQPDILVAYNYQTFTYFMEQQLLTNLQSLTKGDFDPADFHPQLLPLWKDGTALMGVSPYFKLEGIIYNTELFQKYQITLPSESITWNELLVTASLFPQEDDIIGLEVLEENDPFAFVRYLGEKAGLQWISNDGKQLTIDSPSWMDVFQVAATAYQNGILRLDAAPAQKEQSKIAMSRDTIGSLRQIENGWGAIPLPAVAGSNNYNDVAFVDIFGINANSPNIELAWEIIKYITGEEWAAQKQNADGYISTRTKYIGQVGGVDVEQVLNNIAFVNAQSQVTSDFTQKFSQFVRQAFLQIIENNRPVEEVIQELKSEGQLLLETLP
ncbi:ABC transporter substrate-binding protein [Paenibacillus paeoniae]|uniref:Carbohydrate ABC transporter substrate-binding protein n=1 Tax=Paenibacillus paeoniae TaxID=2292705 RepID=A0A371PNC2_9BACL|nr:ABC transporter substrate-binding protein [Paenibacillus paeoniae]REK77712.1 carbohydrate ABC transporter substrate-binding protein [Paenibacillus paeoniae]